MKGWRAALWAATFIAVEVALVVAYCAPAVQHVNHCLVTGAECLAGGFYALAFAIGQLGFAALLIFGTTRR